MINRDAESFNGKLVPIFTNNKKCKLLFFKISDASAVAYRARSFQGLAKHETAFDRKSIIECLSPEFVPILSLFSFFSWRTISVFYDLLNIKK